MMFQYNCQDVIAGFSVVHVAFASKILSFLIGITIQYLDSLIDNAIWYGGSVLFDTSMLYRYPS